jgi:hypothetical protein
MKKVLPCQDHRPLIDHQGIMKQHGFLSIPPFKIGVKSNILMHQFRGRCGKEKEDDETIGRHQGH